MAGEIAESAVTRLDEGEIEASIEQVDVAMDSLAEFGEAVEEVAAVVEEQTMAIRDINDAMAEMFK